MTSTIPARAEPGEAEPQERDAEGRAGEDAAPLITDRPDFTESAAVVKPGRYQAEFGYTYSRLDRLDSHAVGELLLRIPAHRRLELRFGLNSYTFVDGPGTDDSGLEDSSVGVKWKLVDGDPDLGLDRPDVAVIGSTSLPTGDDRFGEDELQPGVTLAVEWDLTERVALGSNVTLSSAVSGDERFGQVSGSVAVGTSVTDRTGAYVEYFGFSEESPDGPSLHFVNGGLTYLLSPDFQLDARIGAGLNGRDDDIFTGFGAAWRW